MTLTVEFDREEDGRWIALIDSIPGCHVYGKTRDEALARVEALALHAIVESASVESGSDPDYKEDRLFGRVIPRSLTSPRSRTGE